MHSSIPFPLAFSILPPSRRCRHAHGKFEGNNKVRSGLVAGSCDWLRVPVLPSSPSSSPSWSAPLGRLVELLQLSAQSTHFLINSCTWGYEDILKAISRTFPAKASHHPYIVLQSTVPKLSLDSRRQVHEVSMDDYTVEGPISWMRKKVVYVNPVNTAWEAQGGDWKKAKSSKIWCVSIFVSYGSLSDF